MIVLMRTTTYIFIILITNDKKQLKPQIKQKKPMKQKQEQNELER